MTCSFSKEFSSSGYTDIENSFITQYLPSSDGDAVKVYLYGLFICQHPEQDRSLADIADSLKMDENAVKDCFTYWEEFGLVSITCKDPFKVVYNPVSKTYSGKPRKIRVEKYTEFTKSLQALIPDRMISTNEYTEYFNIMETYSIKPEAMLMIVNYCIGLKGNGITYRYISKVATDFGNRGLVTPAKVENELSSYNSKTVFIGKILKAMGVSRLPDIDDSNLFKKWTEELNYDPEVILFTASKLKRGNMTKLDNFIMELYSAKCFSPDEISQFIKKKEEVTALTIKINKALSVYVDIIDTEVDTYINKWLSYGFMEDALLYIASICFKRGKNTLQYMDDRIEYLRERGFITLSSLGDYFESLKKADEVITKILGVAGINRRVNNWDRENYNLWKNWNFSDEMIMESAKLSCGKSSPMAYMSSILSNWKNKNIFSPDDIEHKTATNENSQESYNREYERRRSIVMARMQKNNDSAMAIPGFPELIGRLDSIERDMAFAEIDKDDIKLHNLEVEKKALTLKEEELLKTISLTPDDLKPKYFCSKCKDTGFIGTKMCDCFDKKVD